MSAGITYPAGFLDSLPVIVQRKQPYQPIRALNQEQFAQLHALHLLSFGTQSLDETLFPYLHGVEHGSQQLRDYFCSNGQSASGVVMGSNGVEERKGIGVNEPSTSRIMSNDTTCRAPSYRGLIWVPCEDGREDGADGIDAGMYADDGLDEEMLVDDDEINFRRPSDGSVNSSTSIDSAYSLLRNSVTHPPSPTPSPRGSFESARDDVTMIDAGRTLTPLPVPPKVEPILIPCSFKPTEIYSVSDDELLSPKVPEHISLRNFGIQVAAYARVSDIVIYSPSYQGTVSRALLDLAERLKTAIEKVYDQRLAASDSSWTPLSYNVFILISHPSELPPHLLGSVPNFSRLEIQEMQTLTQSSEILPGVYLGNSNDVPVWSSHEAGVNVFDNSNNPYGYDLVVECIEGSATPVPSPSHLKRAEDHINTLQSLWATGFMMSTPPSRPPPNAHSILHLPFPCSPSTQTNFTHITSFISFIQSMMHPQHSSRRAKTLIYCHDGYTETSVLALALILAEKKCTLAEAYIELQVRRGRSFFVHQADLSILKKIESKYNNSSFGGLGRSSLGKSKERGERERSSWLSGKFGKGSHSSDNTSPTESPSRSLRFGKRSIANLRSSVAPDHSAWFNHPKFDGSFPSRVLPFLYLGNLNHAINAHMLHALGITHVVSVGECALIPPDESSMANSAHKLYGDGTLWLEQREGRIKVLDIRNMCDDGMDSLLPQLTSITAWIEQARLEGGRVLVHCRVGVSRSATVTIAYIMKYLEMPLVDSYLVVRSRRLSVLIQPNMRLLFNLLAWEILISRERTLRKSQSSIPAKAATVATDHLISFQDAETAKSLNTALSWPFLAREIHRLNAKYIR